MNQDRKYAQFGLVRDMLETAEVFRRFKTDQAGDTAKAIVNAGRLLLTGEGSSRIFPAKNLISQAYASGFHQVAFHTEAGLQSGEYPLKDWAVFALSNSGKTSEVIKLFTKLKEAGHGNLYSLTASSGSKLESLATKGYVLNCGGENAVAATKSVLEQALFYHALLEAMMGRCTLEGRLNQTADQITQALTAAIPAEMTDALANAGTIYFAGRNNGVAEELTLKTNEITRKKSDFLEGTYAVHGIEEVMDKNDVVVWIDPYEPSEEKFRDVLVKGVGMKVVAISDRQTSFPTIRIASAGDLAPYVQMAAGWNLLVEIGVKLGINLDKPQRARKVGNEFVG